MMEVLFIGSDIIYNSISAGKKMSMNQKNQKKIPASKAFLLE
jgi:hypothetical protein